MPWIGFEAWNMVTHVFAFLFGREEEEDWDGLWKLMAWICVERSFATF